jgi:hypothetical protein
VTFDQQISLTLIDKGLLALLAGIGGFLLNWLLQKKKSRDEILHELTSSRVKAYKRLWAISGKLITSRKDEIPPDVRLQIDQELIEWYYEKGGAMFLSWRATERFLGAVDILRNAKSSSGDIRTAFSRLRTELKRDCGIYSAFESKRVIPQPRPPLEAANIRFSRRREA